MQAVVDTLLTEYNRQGTNKKVILFLHGWGDSSTTFKNLSEQFSKAYTVIALDLPGFGKTQKPEKVWDLDDYASFIRDFLEKQNISDVYAIVGHSNGAAVAINGVAHGVLRPQKLVLLGAAGIRNVNKAQKQLFNGMAKTGKALTFWLPAQHKKRLQKKLYSAVGSDMLIAPGLEDTFKKTVAHDLQSEAQKITIPTLLIYGEDDVATPPHYGEIYARLMSGSNLQIVKGAGHFVHHDQSQKVVDLMKDFLS